MRFDTIYGVDFSGAKLAGRNTWVAELEPLPRRRRRPLYLLKGLWRLEKLCGTPARPATLCYLVDLIMASHRALWGLDFPFGVPIEIMPPRARWADQLDLLRSWRGDGYDFGLECLRRARALGGPGHIRRQTDLEEKAPFDPYHYRIIYQTFHGMRDVLAPLQRRYRVAVLPFHYRRLPTAQRVVVEACPASTLKRLDLPYRNYKQPQGGRLLPKRRRTKRSILDGLAGHVEFNNSQRLVMMRNGGGDALDAVVAAVGAASAWGRIDHRETARHFRYNREGRLYV